MDQSHGCNSIRCILRYQVILILVGTVERGVRVIYCSERLTMWGNNDKMDNIIRYQYSNTIETTSDHYKYI